MLDKPLTITVRFTGSLLAFLFAVSMFMCGDAECLTGQGDSNCASLLCSLLDKHETSPQNPTSSADQDCSCVCHVLTIVGPIFNFKYFPVVKCNSDAVGVQIPSTPHRLIYHPPTYA